jgi:hypothetical protein
MFRVGELADGSGCLRISEETPPTIQNCSTCKDARREPWFLSRNETSNRKMIMMCVKSLKMRLETMKRLSYRVKGQIGVNENLQETRVARLAECRQNKRRVTTSTPTLLTYAD